MQEFKLQEGENLIETIKGTYWESIFLFLYEQNIGDIVITNQRIIFFIRMIAASMLELEIQRENIETIEKCNVGSFIPWNPTGIKIVTKDGKVYKFSSRKREKILDHFGRF